MSQIALNVIFQSNFNLIDSASAFRILRIINVICLIIAHFHNKQSSHQLLLQSLSGINPVYDSNSRLLVGSI
ncbi:MAG TPA: hypothetical protein DD473_01150 [Planctomycetaceae bacterium]|nr:hypothetical protein [Planctomycetaceae bacterium]